MEKLIKNGILFTRAEIQPTTFNDEKGTVDVIWTTGEKVLRQSYFSDPYYEELDVTNEAVNLSRLNSGAPILDTHKRDNLSSVIGVVERAWIQGGIGLATIRFSDREEITPIRNDVKTGIIRNISCGYSVERYLDVSDKDDNIKTYRAIEWTPAEISFVPIGADSRSQVRTADLYQTIIEEEEKMEKENEKMEPAIDLIAVERSRISEINKLVRNANLDMAIAEDLVSTGSSVDEARALVLDKLIANQPKVSNTTSVVDAKENLFRGLESALLARSGLEKNDPQNEYRGYSLVEIARKFDPRNGHGDKIQVVGRAFSTSDFPLLLANVAGKSLQTGYESSPETWSLWTRTVSVSDFKIQSLVGLGEFSALDQVPEGAEYKYGSLSEKREQYALGTYGKLFSITRQAIINDDLNAISGIPMSMGRAAARKVGDVCYSVLTTNAALSDGIALFHGSHANLTTGAPTVTTVDTAKGLMALQKDVSGTSVLNIRPGFFIVPVALEGTAKILMTSQYDPNATNKLQLPNAVAGLATVVSEARLDSASTTAWYLVANPSAADTIIVAFLDGNQTPALEQQAGWSIDGTEFKVRLDFASKAVDFRGMVKSSG